MLETRIADAWAQFDAARRPLSQRNEKPIRPERIMAELQRLLTPDTIVVADASYASMWVVGPCRGCWHDTAGRLTIENTTVQLVETIRLDTRHTA